MQEQNIRWQQFIERSLKFKSEPELQLFFDVILTPSEKIEFGNRLAILSELISAKKTQREIARSLNVSIANISRGSNVIKNSQVNLKEFLKFDIK